VVPQLAEGFSSRFSSGFCSLELGKFNAQWCHERRDAVRVEGILESHVARHEDALVIGGGLEPEKRGQLLLVSGAAEGKHCDTNG
jgi:hypothetical protein